MIKAKMKGLGSRIKFLRKSKRITLVEMAEKTGLDQATLSRIENGKMTGTLNSHMRISQVLEIRLPDLYEQVLDKIDRVKEDKIKQKLETFSHSSGAVAELLTTGILQKKMMPIGLKIKPKGYTETEKFAKPTERFIYVLRGKVTINIGKENKLLNQDESLYFDASLPHFFKNPTSAECHCLSVTTPMTS